MERTIVVSSTAASIGYDDHSTILEIEFIKGGIYQYFSVPRDVYDDLMASPSKGSFINTKVRNVFSCTKVG